MPRKATAKAEAIEAIEATEEIDVAKIDKPTVKPIKIDTRRSETRSR